MKLPRMETVSGAHGPSAMEGQGHAATPALRISDHGYCQFVDQNTIGTMADPIDSALLASPWPTAPIHANCAQRPPSPPEPQGRQG
jgi:hypothetical protein